jgi:hypothetical protein
VGCRGDQHLVSSRRYASSANVAPRLEYAWPMNGIRYGPGRLIGVVVLAVVVLGIGLLIAGYGVPVGLGALVGLVLGFVAGSVGSLWLARGPGRSVTYGTREWSSDSTTPGPDEIAEMRDLAEISAVSLGAIRSVTPVLSTAEAAGLVVQLVTIEHHEGGLTMILEVRPRPGTVSPGSIARVRVSDELGTRYRALAMSQSGSAGEIRYTLTAIPAPPAEATRIDVVIERFDDLFPGRSRDGTAGPWWFSVSLNRK